MYFIGTVTLWVHRPSGLNQCFPKVKSFELNCVIVILCKALSDTRVMQIQSSIVRCAIQQGLVAELVSGLSGMISCLLRGEKEY